MWLSWHIPGASRKVCPYKVLACRYVAHVIRGQIKLLEMKVAIEGLMSSTEQKINRHNKYSRDCRNIHELSEIFDAFKYVMLTS